MTILAMLALFESFAIPLLGGDMHLVAPWDLVSEVGTLTFHAAVFFGVLLLLVALPLPYLARTLTLLGAGVTLLAFGVLHMQLAIDAFAFRGQPALGWVFTDSGAAFPLLLAALSYPAALYWRGRYTDSFGSRIAVLLTMLVVLACYFALGMLSEGDGTPPMVALIRALTRGEGLRADTISAALALVPAATLLLGFLAFLRHPRTGLAGLWAWLFVTALAAIPMVQAGFVSSFGQGGWKYALAPFKASLFLYAGLLVAPLALGHLVGEVGRLVRRRR